MVRSLWIGLCLLALLSSQVSGQSLSLEDAVFEALQTDPRLKRDGALLDGARQYSEAAGALPNPVVRLSAVSGTAREDANSITQTFEIAGQPSLRRRAALQAYEAADAGLEKTRREVARESSRAYYDYWEARAVHDLYVRQMAFSQKLGSVATKRLSMGEISAHEEFRAQQTVANARIARAQAKGALLVARRKLETLVGHSVSFPAEEGVPSAPEFSFLFTDEVDQLAQSVERRPELVIAQRVAKRAKFRSDLAGRAGAPDVQVGAYRSTLSNLATQGVQFSVVVPLFDWGRLGAESARRRSIAEASAHEVSVVRREMDLEFYSAVSRYEVATEKRSAARELADDYLRFVDVAQKGYELGLLSFVEVYDSQTANLRGFETYLRAEADYRRAQVELWWASGLPLSENALRFSTDSRRKPNS